MESKPSNISRHSACICGSGRKYKYCCGIVEQLATRSSIARRFGLPEKIRVQPYLSIEEVDGERVPIETIRGWVRGMGARQLFGRVADLAAAIANREDPRGELRKFT